MSRVLFVDDEPRVLDGIRRVLRGTYDLEFAEGGRTALDLVEREEFAVIVSDMKMPGMSGPEFLAHAAALQPDAVQMVLSGHADLASTVAAVNDGNLFRFLMKPTDRAALGAALDAALEQHRLRRVERDLLEQTVTGAIDALVDLLSITSPSSARRATLVRQYVSRVVTASALANDWQLRVAATVADIGLVAVPDDVVRRSVAGEHLSLQETLMLKRHPGLAARVIAHIPRLDEVAAIVQAQVPGTATDDPRAVVLQLATEVADGVLRGLPEPHAIALAEQSERYPAWMFAGLHEKPLPVQIVEVPPDHLHSGMVLQNDLCTPTGAIIATAGTTVTVAMIERIQNFAAGFGVRDPIVVEVHADREIPPPAGPRRAGWAAT